MLVKKNRVFWNRGTKKQFCPKGHDTFICGRDKRRTCNQCVREKNRRNYKPHPRKSKLFCKYGHNISMVGRDSQGACKECRRNRSLKLDHHILPEQYNKLLKLQNGKCKLCEKDEFKFKYKLSIDHDHKCCPGKKSCGNCIRGLLCPQCNWSLGVLENIEFCSKATIYLKEYKELNASKNVVQDDTKNGNI